MITMVSCQCRSSSVSPYGVIKARLIEMNEYGYYGTSILRSLSISSYNVQTEARYMNQLNL